MPSDESTLLDILQAARRAVEGLGNSPLQSFIRDWKAQSIVEHQLLVLGEAVKRLSWEFRDRYRDVPWRQMAGLRDVLMHGYDIVDLETVWTVVVRDLPPFISFLESLDRPEGEQ